MATLKVYQNKDAFSTYKQYCIDKGIKPFTAKEFLTICKLYSKKLLTEIIDKANTGSLGYYLGTIYIRKNYRIGKSKRPNWGQCKRDENGKIIEMAYYEGGFFCNYEWVKSFKYSRKLFNIVFKPSKGAMDSPHNNIRRLKNAIDENPELHNKYKVNSVYYRIHKRDPDTMEILAEYNYIWQVEKDGFSFSNIAKAINNEKLAYGHVWTVEKRIKAKQD